MAPRALVLAVQPCYADALTAKAAHLRRRARAWWQPRHREASRTPGAEARRQALAELYAERDGLRQGGELLDSAAAIVIHHLRGEIAARGWERRWKPIPRGQDKMPGRRWGSPDNPGRDWTARVCLSVDGDLVDLLHRATWWTSLPATRALQQDGFMPPGVHPVVTTGDVLRAVIRTATADWFPGPLP